MQAPAIGSRILCRDSEWRVSEVDYLSNNRYVVKCIGVDDFVRGREGRFISDLERIEPLEPEDTRITADTSSEYIKSRLYLEAQLRSNPTSSKKPDLDRMGAFDRLLFQEEAVAAALSQSRVRLLLADEVGLGKTIQVGMIVSELIRRGRGDKILVLTKKSMLSQFQAELWNRFAIPLTRLDSRGIEKVKEVIPVNKNPFDVYYRVIISIDTLKNENFAPKLRNTDWDIVIIDEAHNVAGATNPDRNQSYQLARNLSNVCQNMLLTTATPHNGKKETFGRLLSLLDPTLISDPSFREYDLEAAKNYFLMRSKVEVKSQLDEYIPKPILISSEQTTASATAREEQVFEILAEFRKLARGKKKGSGRKLLGYGLYKLFLSSPEACLQSTKNRIRNIEGQEQEGDASAAELELLHNLKGRLEGFSIAESSRFKLLIKQLKKIGWKPSGKGPRVVLFCESVETHLPLAKAVAKEFGEEFIPAAKIEDYAKASIFILNGRLGDEEIEEQLELFGKGDAKVRMLIAGDVASEGINLHHECHHLIHYDLPWSIITLVQREGRIDRLGQKKSPEFRYIFVKSEHDTLKGDNRVFEKLIEKAHTVEEQTGKRPGHVLRVWDPEKEYEIVGEEAFVEGKGEDFESFAASGEDAEARDQSSFQNELDKLNKEKTLSFAERRRQLLAEESEAPAQSLARVRTLSDEDYLKLAFSQFAASGQAVFQPQRQGPETALQAPERMLKYLGKTNTKQGELINGRSAIAPEVIPENDVFKFSGDFEHIKQCIEAARESKGRWSEVSPLVDLHPILNWVGENLLVSIERGEAPYITSSGLEKGELCYIFFGLVSSQKSLPVASDIHAVLMKKGSIEVQDFRLVARRAFASHMLINTGDTPNLANAQKNLSSAVALSKERVALLVKDSRKVQREVVLMESRRLDAWARDREEVLFSRYDKESPLRKRAEKTVSTAKETVRVQKKHFENLLLPTSEGSTRLVLVAEGV